MYFIYLQKLLRRGRMIIQCLQLTEALENPQKTSSAFGLGGFLRIFHASARCKHRIIPVSVPQGWCGSADPRKRQFETKHSEADEMRKEIEEIKMTKEMEHLDRTSSVSSDFLSI